MIGKEEHGFLLGIGCGGERGVMTCGVAAKDDFGLGWFLDSLSLRADRHAAIPTGSGRPDPARRRYSGNSTATACAKSGRFKWYRFGMPLFASMLKMGQSQTAIGIWQNFTEVKVF